MDPNMIARINALAKKSKNEGLTPEEKEEQTALRQEYLAQVRAAVIEQMKHTVIEMPDGTRHPMMKKEP